NRVPDAQQEGRRGRPRRGSPEGRLKGGPMAERERVIRAVAEEPADDLPRYETHSFRQTGVEALRAASFREGLLRLELSSYTTPFNQGQLEAFLPRPWPALRFPQFNIARAEALAPLLKTPTCRTCASSPCRVGPARVRRPCGRWRPLPAAPRPCF